MIAATPAASGSAVGAWMPSTGCESCPGLRSSACAREPACTAAISGAAIGIGESCQFQNRVRSIFSAALKRPSTASANTPPDGSGITAPGEWYAALAKPSFNPPNWLFAPVWTVLYVLIAVAGWRTFERDQRGGPMKLWWAQLALNFLWSPVFFGAHRIGLALLIILL